MIWGSIPHNSTQDPLGPARCPFCGEDQTDDSRHRIRQQQAHGAPTITPKPPTSHQVEIPTTSLPTGPKVVPFWDYLQNSKKEPQKGAILGPMGKPSTRKNTTQQSQRNHPDEERERGCQKSFLVFHRHHIRRTENRGSTSKPLDLG